ncbi:transcriptional regulator [Salmonella enterica subsp. enterica serovar Madelia]|nr:transcriptional regulator [Salmonella enterica subsp. enterica serovar Madelia]
MLELSITLPIKVQNGGLFISRGIGRHPARRLQSWEIIFVEKGCLKIQEEECVFCVEAGESCCFGRIAAILALRSFPADLKFYWLHFEVKAPDSDPRWLTHLSVPQHTQVADPQALIALFRQFMNEQEKHQRSPALEFIVLLILQQLTVDARQNEKRRGRWRVAGLESTAADSNALSPAAFQLGSGERTALQCGLSGTRLSAGISLTLTEAIHRQRVREAEKLLISDARSLKRVAERCGFNDVGYFRQIFRKHTGLTPTAWKRRYSKEHVNS